MSLVFMFPVEKLENRYGGLVSINYFKYVNGEIKIAQDAKVHAPPWHCRVHPVTNFVYIEKIDWELNLFLSNVSFDYIVNSSNQLPTNFPYKRVKAVII